MSFLKTAIFACFLVVISAIISAYAQQYPSGNWIKGKVTYSDGSELREDMIIKYSYLRLEFPRQGIIKMATNFDHKGTPLNFALKGNLLEIKNEIGYVMNRFMIEENNSESLVLLQEGAQGFKGQDVIRFYYIPEKTYQASFVPSGDYVLSIMDDDTIFIANTKLYPIFKGDKSLFDALKQGIPDQGSINGHFLATFIVDENGFADSLKIIESFSKKFDAKVLKNFYKVRSNWVPANYKGKPVQVQMKQEFRYFSSATMLPMYDYEKKGTSHLEAKNYDIALAFFDEALTKVPDNVEILFKRAICKYELGNVEGACKDLGVIKSLNSELGKELGKKWCE